MISNHDKMKTVMIQSCVFHNRRMYLLMRLFKEMKNYSLHQRDSNNLMKYINCCITFPTGVRRGEVCIILKFTPWRWNLEAFLDFFLFIFSSFLYFPFMLWWLFLDYLCYPFVTETHLYSFCHSCVNGAGWEGSRVKAFRILTRPCHICTYTSLNHCLPTATCYYFHKAREPKYELVEKT